MWRFARRLPIALLGVACTSGGDGRSHDTVDAAGSYSSGDGPAETLDDSRATDDGSSDACPFGSSDDATDTCADASIQASNYGQTCQKDSDCVLVGEGESCTPCSLACGPFGAINRSSVAQYEADVAKTPGGNAGPVSCAPCCGPAIVACCAKGQCQADLRCAADAGS